MAQRPYQITREQLTDEEWHHMSKVMFPVLLEAKRKAQAIMAQRKREQAN